MTPLEGIKILDLSRLAPGPFATMVMGDLGADVLMIEAPSQFVSGIARSKSDLAMREGVFNAMRRNKRSIRLNLKEAKGQAIFHELVKDADVVFEGFRPGVTKRLGVDYDTLSKINPRIIVCSVTGFGQDGPYAQQVGHDINYISTAGFLGQIGWPGQPPAIPLNVVADFAAGGMHAAMAVMAAIIARATTGKGQSVDIAMSDGVMYLMAFWGGAMLSGQPPVTPGSHMLNGAVPQYNVYLTKDEKWISIGSLETKFWVNLCKVMDCEQWIETPFDEQLYPEIKAHFTEKFKTRSRKEWMKILTDVEICAAPVYTLDEAMEDPHNKARGMNVELEHPVHGKINHIGIGPKFSDTPGSIRLLPPEEGEHTEEVLSKIGYSAEQIEALQKEGVL